MHIHLFNVRMPVLAQPDDTEESTQQWLSILTTAPVPFLHPPNSDIFIYYSSGPTLGARKITVIMSILEHCAVCNTGT